VSYDYHAIAVKSGVRDVRTSLEAFALARGGFIRTIAQGDFRGFPADFLLHSHGDWTVLACAYFGIMPALAVHLSADSAAEAFCVAAYEPRGFEHFNLLRAGRVIQLFTSIDDFIEMQGIDSADFASRIQPDKFRAPPREDVTGANFRYHAYAIFCSCVAPFDLEEFVQDRWNDASPGGGISVCIPHAHRYQLGARTDSFSWQAHLEPIAHRPSSSVSAPWWQRIRPRAGRGHAEPWETGHCPVDRT
jgi:hypothetical protein